jgi:tetratricopeptide (TPR) repeat protein
VEDAKLQIVTQIARTHSLEGEFELAHAQLDRVEATLSNATQVLRARYGLERGRTFRSDKKPVEARPHFLQAFEAASKAKHDFLAIDAAHMLAITKADDQPAWHDRALTLARATTDERARGWLGSLLNNKAWALHDAKKLPEALALFQEAEAFFATTDKPKALKVAKYSVGRCLRSMGRVDEAWALQIAIVDGEDGYVLEELGELALLKEEPAHAWFAKAHAALSKDAWLVANEPERLERMQRLSEGK